jgi:hypothetical protein
MIDIAESRFENRLLGDQRDKALCSAIQSNLRSECARITLKTKHRVKRLLTGGCNSA